MSAHYGEYIECCGLDTGWFGSSLIHSITKPIGHAITGAAKAIGKGASTVAKTAAKYNPIVAQVQLAKQIASGKNVKAAASEFARNNISSLRAGASLAPGGQKLAAGLDSIVAVGRGANLKNVAAAAVRQNLPPDQQKAFDAAVGLIKTGASPAALAAARNIIAGTPELRAAFDGAAAIAHGANASQIAQTISAHAHPVAKNIVAKIASVHQIVASHAPPPQLRTLDPKKRPARAGRKARPLSPRAKAFIAKRVVQRGTKALKDEHTYTVERNDSAFRISQNLTGSPTLPIAPSKLPPWKELLMANTQIPINDGYNKIRPLRPGEVPTNAMNFAYLKVGTDLHVPQNWIDAAKAQAAKKLGIDPPAARVATPAAPAPAPAGAPSSVMTLPGPGQEPAAPPPAAALPKTAVIVNPGATQGERDDAQAVAQAKLILTAWGGTDGAGSTTLTDYGANPGDVSPLWGSRDNLELRSFVNWANKHGSQLATAGDLTQAKLDALVAWSEAKSKAVAVSTPAPPVNITAPVPMQKPAEPSPKPEPDLPGPANEPATVMNGSAAPAPVTTVPSPDQASMAGGSINVPETLIAGQPKSNSDIWLLVGVAGLALVASSGKKSRGRAA